MKLELTLMGLAMLGLAVGCGGNVTGSGGSGGSGATGGTGNTGASSSSGGTGGTTTTPVPCVDHSDCGDGHCVFSTGFCSPACASATPCAAGELCDECGTSSCPACDDCVAACVPVADGNCDDHGDCGEGQVCIFVGQANKCGDACTVDTDCKTPGDYCNPCGTYSCISCDDCVSACSYAD